jgi:hypothetical protein
MHGNSNIKNSKNILYFFLPLKQKVSRNRGLYLPSNKSECALPAGRGLLNTVIPSDIYEQVKKLEQLSKYIISLDYV